MRSFIRKQSRYEFGLVSHALTAEMKVILREFDTLVVQMENLLRENKLTLQKMVYLLQPSRITFKILEGVVTVLSNLTGGHLLDKLYGLMVEQGDTKSRKIHERLLRKAAVPYIEMLNLWLSRWAGVIFNVACYRRLTLSSC